MNTITSTSPLHTGRLGAWLLLLLDRSAVPTWIYERRALLALELVCHVATIAAAPSLLAALVLLLGAPLAARGSLLAQTARSAGARKRELSTAQGLPAVLLDCELRVESEAREAQLLAGVQPLVVLICSVVSAGGSLTGAAAVSAGVCAARFGWARGYDAWRVWMRARRPLTVER